MVVAVAVVIVVVKVVVLWVGGYNKGDTGFGGTVMVVVRALQVLDKECKAQLYSVDFRCATPRSRHIQHNSNQKFVLAAFV